jgi:hypothetical protein
LISWRRLFPTVKTKAKRPNAKIGSGMTELHGLHYRSVRACAEGIDKTRWSVAAKSIRRPLGFSDRSPERERSKALRHRYGNPPTFDMFLSRWRSLLTRFETRCVGLLRSELIWNMRLCHRLRIVHPALGFMQFVVDEAWPRGAIKQATTPIWRFVILPAEPVYCRTSRRGPCPASGTLSRR